MTAIVTIGNFDGVHRGHQMLLRQVVDRARVLGLRSYAVTFDPHPERILVPHRRLQTLTEASEKEDLIRASGIDDVWTCPFTFELSRLGPEEFIHLVTERQAMAELWIGSDFALGRGRSGTISVLADIGGHSGWGLHMVPPYRLEGQVVSSTAIRTLLGAGALRGAADLLGRSYAAVGELSAGGEPSSGSGLADAILTVPGERALPRGGLYAAQLRQDETVRDGMVLVPPSSDDIHPPPSRLEVRYTTPPGPTGGKAMLTFTGRVRTSDDSGAAT